MPVNTRLLIVYWMLIYHDNLSKRSSMNEERIVNKFLYGGQKQKQNEEKRNSLSTHKKQGSSSQESYIKASVRKEAEALNRQMCEQDALQIGIERVIYTFLPIWMRTNQGTHWALPSPFTLSRRKTLYIYPERQEWYCAKTGHEGDLLDFVIIMRHMKNRHEAAQYILNTFPRRKRLEKPLKKVHGNTKMR